MFKGEVGWEHQLERHTFFFNAKSPEACWQGSKETNEDRFVLDIDSWPWNCRLTWLIHRPENSSSPTPTEIGEFFWGKMGLLEEVCTKNPWDSDLKKGWRFLYKSKCISVWDESGSKMLKLWLKCLAVAFPFGDQSWDILAMWRVVKDCVFQGNFTAKEVDMTGKTVVITGPSRGGILAKGR